MIPDRIKSEASFDSLYKYMLEEKAYLQIPKEFRSQPTRLGSHYDFYLLTTLEVAELRSQCSK